MLIAARPHGRLGEIISNTNQRNKCKGRVFEDEKRARFGGQGREQEPLARRTHPETETVRSSRRVVEDKTRTIVWQITHCGTRNKESRTGLQRNRTGRKGFPRGREKPFADARPSRVCQLQISKSRSRPSPHAFSTCGLHNNYVVTQNGLTADFSSLMSPFV